MASIQMRQLSVFMFLVFEFTKRIFRVTCPGDANIAESSC
jgi:hypothetical protein